MTAPAQRARHRAQRENTRGEILAEADRLLRERPYRELSVDVVMAGTGLTRTAFYRHFDDVTALVLRLLAEAGHELFDLAQDWSETAGTDDLAAARAGLTGIVDFFVSHGPLVRAFAEAGANDEQIEQAYRGALDTFTEITTQTLDRLVREGRLQLPDTGAVARALNLMNEAYLLDEFGREPFGDPKIALETLQTVWLRVVGPRSHDLPSQ